LGAALSLWAPAAAQVLVLEDPLTSPGGPPKDVTGGTFSAEGWRRDSFESKIVYDLGRVVIRGRVTFEMNGVNGMDHGVGGWPDCRAIFAALDSDGAGNLGNQNIWVWAMDKTEICNGENVPPYRTNRMKLLLRTLFDPEPGEPMSAELSWDATRFYTYEITWDEHRGTLRRDGDVVLDIAYPAAPLRMSLRFLFLGTIHRYRAGVREATYRNLKVWDLGGAPPPDAGMPPPDAGVPPSGPCLRAVSLVPASGAGASEMFRATYRHCEGAAAFRIVQIWVGDVVAPAVPALAGAFENGFFSLGVPGESCVPGERKVLRAAYGALDCARSMVTSAGTDLTALWALSFDAARFAGPHRVYFDAKGGPGAPEPRLGWTEMGAFTVVAPPDAGTAAPDGGASDGGLPPRPSDGGSPPRPQQDGGVPATPAPDAGAATPPVSGGCAVAPPAAPFPMLCLLAWLWVRRRRALRVRPRSWRARRGWARAPAAAG
jgi:hypothetical protein